MDGGTLRVLRELRDRGSVSGAAEALGVSPSAVSQHLTAAQRQAQVPLTHKVGRRVELTAAGHEVADRADAALRALADVDQALRHLTPSERRPVTVSAFQTAGIAFFPPLMALNDVEVHCTDFDVPRERFRTLPAEVDVVIAHRSMHTDPWPRSLHVTPLLIEPFDIALSSNHPASGRALTHADLAALEWISVHDDFPLASALDLLAAEAGGPLKITHRINDYGISAALVARSELACLLPRHTGATHPGVSLHPSPGLAPTRRIDALTRPERLSRPEAREVLNALEEIAKNLVAHGTEEA